jgi:conjugal transfer pilin signal peptidase TrbI
MSVLNSATSLDSPWSVRLSLWWKDRAPKARRRMPWAIGALMMVMIASQYVALAWVMTESVGASAVLVLKGAPPRKGELFAFEYQGQVAGSHRKGELFVKFLAGAPGDKVVRAGRTFSIGGKPLGTAKMVSLSGVALEAASPGVIPDGYLYAYAPHKDALDSRYALMGLVHQSSVIGRAIKLF